MIQNEIKAVLNSNEDIYSKYDKVEAILDGAENLTEIRVTGNAGDIHTVTMMTKGHQGAGWYLGGHIEYTSTLVELILTTGFIA